jgi:carboxypeptidase PM20D1
MLKRLALAGTTLLLTLAAVLVVRTLQVPSPAPAATASAVVEVDEAQAAERLAEAVRFRTISYQTGAPIDTAAFLGLHGFLARSFPLAHATLRRELIGGLSLLYTWPGQDSTLEPVVLMGHIDVVPVTEENRAEWLHDPFAGTIADGYVWGRGTLDDKTTVIAILEAVEGMLAAGLVPQRTVYLMFGHDEEVGGRFGASVIVDTLVARGVRPALVLDEGGFLTSGAIPGVEGRAAIVGIAEKGYLSLVLTARAQGGHSSMPSNRTAVGALSAAISKLLANPFQASLDGPTATMLEAMAPYSGFGQRAVLANLWLTSPFLVRMLNESPMGGALTRTTIAPTMLDAGVKDNVLPPEARAVVNFRIRPGETKESVIARVRDVIADTLILVAERDSANRDPSAVSDVNSPAFRLIAQTIRGMAPGEQLPVLPYLVMGGTDAKFWSAHSDRVFRFLAIPLGDGDVARVHGVNERLAVADYRTAVGFFAQLLRGLNGL